MSDRVAVPIYEAVDAIWLDDTVIVLLPDTVLVQPVIEEVTHGRSASTPGRTDQQ